MKQMGQGRRYKADEARWMRWSRRDKTARVRDHGETEEGIPHENKATPDDQQCN